MKANRSNKIHKSDEEDLLITNVKTKNSEIDFSRQPKAIKSLIFSFLSNQDLNSILPLNKEFYEGFPQYRLIHLEWQLNTALPTFQNKQNQILTYLIEEEKLAKKNVTQMESDTRKCIKTSTFLSLGLGALGCFASGLPCFWQCCPPVCMTFFDISVSAAPACMTTATFGQSNPICCVCCYPLSDPCIVGYGLLGSSLSSLSIVGCCSLNFHGNINGLRHHAQSLGHQITLQEAVVDNLTNQCIDTKKNIVSRMSIFQRHLDSLRREREEKICVQEEKFEVTRQVQLPVNEGNYCITM
jgi:hypothetical protein